MDAKEGPQRDRLLNISPQTLNKHKVQNSDFTMEELADTNLAISYILASYKWVEVTSKKNDISTQNL